MMVRWQWVAPILAGVLVALLVVAVGARAETRAQLDVGKARVLREAVRLQHEQQTGAAAPRTRYFVWHTEDRDADVRMRWRIRVQTDPQAGTAGWLVCTGHVRVRGDATTDRDHLYATLTRTGCIA
jgi:hypothetical protein